MVEGQTLDAEKLLVAAGRRPNLPDLGLDTVGLDPSARAIEVDDAMRAGDGLWAVGDVTGKGAFTHISMYQSAICVRDILDQDGPPADYRAVPRVTFTDPEVGSVGMTEKQARDAGLNVRVAQTDLAASTRGWIAKSKGLVKLVEDADRGVLVGATAVGPSGGEMLSMLTTAVHAEVPDGHAALDDLRLPDLPPRRRGDAGRARLEPPSRAPAAARTARRTPAGRPRRRPRRAR